MSAQLDMGFARAELRTRRGWTIHPRPGCNHSDYSSALGMVVKWCGHATALFPYYVVLPDGRLLDIYADNPGELGPRQKRAPCTTFRTAAEAKFAAERWEAGRCLR